MTRQSKPTISERAREAICPECGGQVVRRSVRGPMPTFCTPECKRAHGNRHIVEGRAVIAFLKAWRIDRGTGEIAKSALAQMCQIVDQFNANDRDAGRPRADLYAAKLMADGRLFMDRQNQRNAASAKRASEGDSE